MPPLAPALSSIQCIHPCSRSGCYGVRDALGEEFDDQPFGSLNRLNGIRHYGWRRVARSAKRQIENHQGFSTGLPFLSNVPGVRHEVVVASATVHHIVRGWGWTGSQNQNAPNSMDYCELRFESGWGRFHLANTHDTLKGPVTSILNVAPGVTLCDIVVLFFFTSTIFLRMPGSLFSIRPGCLAAQFHRSVVLSRHSGLHCNRLGVESLSCITMMSQSVQNSL